MKRDLPSGRSTLGAVEEGNVVAVGTLGNVTPPVEGLLRGVQSAERRGYDSIWWPDHLMGWHPQSIWDPEIIPLAAFSPNPHIFLDSIAAMAAAAVHTERVQLATSVTEPVRRHPAMLAQEFLTLDHLSHGRVILGIGAGERENIEPYGLDHARPVARLEESLEIIRLLWEHDEPVSFDGSFWTLRDAVCGMAPYDRGDGQRRYPPIWAGAHGPRMLDLVGRACDGWLPTYTGGPDAWSAALDVIRAAERKAGRPDDAVTPGIYAMMLVDEDEDEVERMLDTPVMRGWMLVTPAALYEELGFRHPLGDGFNGLFDYVPSRLSREDALTAIAAVPPEVTRTYSLSGTPDTIVSELREFIARGLEHVVLWNVTFMADPSKLRSSFALQDEIMAAIKA